MRNGKAEDTGGLEPNGRILPVWDDNAVRAAF